MTKIYSIKEETSKEISSIYVQERVSVGEAVMKLVTRENSLKSEFEASKVDIENAEREIDVGKNDMEDDTV